jgi:hypothetical protein
MTIPMKPSGSTVKAVTRWCRWSALGLAPLMLILFLWPRIGSAREVRPDGGAAEAIQVAVTTHLGDGHRFVRGDSIAFFLSLNQAAHIVAVYEDADHHRIQILPNAKQQDNFYPRGMFSPFPGKDAGFRFTITPPFGRERLWVFASRAPIADLPGELLANGLKRLSLDIPTIQARIRAQAGSAYGEYCLPLDTLAAPAH